MSWLIRDGDVLAAIQARQKGWSGLLTGAAVVPAPAFLHTLGVPNDLDVAWCVTAPPEDAGAALQVKKIRCVKQGRVAPPQLRAGALIVGRAGSFERWRLQVGDRLEIRES